MGRLATYIAGRASSADKLPGQLPKVSLIDALLPSIISGCSPGRGKVRYAGPNASLHRALVLILMKFIFLPQHTSPHTYLDMYPFFLRVVLKVSLVDSDTGQPLADKDKDHDRGSTRGSVTHTDVTKDKKGRLVLIQHRDKSADTSSVGGQDAGTPQEMKKELQMDVNDLKFTPDEDAKLIELKAGDPNMQWAKVEEEIKRNKDDAKQRYTELKQQGKVASSDARGDFKQIDSNQNGNNQKDFKDDSNKESGGDNKPQGDWTAAEDAIIRAGMANGDKAQDIATRLDGRFKKQVNARIGQLKKKDGEQSKNEGENKGKTERKAKEGADKGEHGSGNQTNKQKNEDNKQSEDQKKNEDNKKSEDQHKSKREDARKKDETKPKAPSSKAGSSRSEAKFTMREWMMLQEDDMFSFRELQLLSELIAQDARESRDGAYSWLRVASLFADRTDRRVHPEDIREKFEAMLRD